ncbi:hypothetical protein MKX67_13395 [Cytobacillus sp. FSL W7-1323]|uniref:Uncharacterized protein n=1 Tax=Cytobacillus stercorigallinarum TaxID=2762240 RepID=A0ABR8QVN3_9BACI|nr:MULTISPECIES: hypothetical protein [Cytobacillus]MBD7939605.1 hypothetical protein [Cytobacillus stercorigallinarum]MEA1852627.1 hypothetical protein [Cytobacillus sp. OWB-43]MED1604500.1 hypothetical protein [Cytobacillus kochii]
MKKYPGFLLIFIGIVLLYFSFKLDVSPIVAILLLLSSLIANIAGTVVLVKLIITIQRKAAELNKEE